MNQKSLKEFLLKREKLEILMKKQDIKKPPQPKEGNPPSKDNGSVHGQPMGGERISGEEIGRSY